MLDPAIQATFETCLGAVRRGDEAAMRSCFREDAEGYTSRVGELRGPAAFAAAIKALHALLPGFRMEPLRTYGEGPEMAARMRLLADGKEAEGLFAFRFDPEGRIARLIVLWEPSELLDAAPGHLDPALRSAVEAYFRTYNDDDVAAHMALVSPDLVYFGAVSRMTAEGIETARGIFRTAHDRMGLKRFEPIRVFGTGPHVAVLARIRGAGAGGPTEEGIWVFRFDAKNRFDRVSVLWNPGTFLTWNHK
ncbi:MAG TPA: nuclear transport factor 2 family protein [Holophagaceae bacterium]|nr:nuclear transport factor 2 family protein [Holophagaceae bacterium]